MIASSNDSEELTVTNKEVHVLHFWLSKASDCIAETHREVTVGEVARFVGQSRATAKKYLERLVKEGALSARDVTFKNGTVGKVYEHVI